MRFLGFFFSDFIDIKDIIFVFRNELLQLYKTENIMIRILTLLFVGVVVLQSCSPTIKKTLMGKEYNPLGENVDVLILSNEKALLPENLIHVGELKILDGFTFDCGREITMERAKIEARKIGGNIVQITKLKKPDISSTCYRLTANVYYGRETELIEKIIEEEQFKSQEEQFKVEQQNKIVDSLQRINNFYKGDVRLKLALPFFNMLKLKPRKDLRTTRYGFLGESIGIEYSVKDNMFIETNFSLAGTAKDIYETFDVEEEKLYTYYFSLTNNHVYKKHSLGYGINLSNNYKGISYRSLNDSIPSYSNGEWSQALGLTLNTSIKPSKHFNLGIIYRPTIYRIKPQTEFVLEQLISVEILWRIRLRRNKKFKERK